MVGNGEKLYSHSLSRRRHFHGTHPYIHYLFRSFYLPPVVAVISPVSGGQNFGKEIGTKVVMSHHGFVLLVCIQLYTQAHDTFPKTLLTPFGSVGDFLGACPASIKDNKLAKRSNRMVRVLWCKMWPDQDRSKIDFFRFHRPHRKCRRQTVYC